MNTTHDKFNEMPTTADCTRALDEANRSLDNAERFESEVELLRLITQLREAERATGRLKGVAAVQASRLADAASVALHLEIRKLIGGRS